MLTMLSQRRKASQVSEEERKKRGEKLTANLGCNIVEESETVKTLGITFDSLLIFRNYWEDLRKKIQNTSYAVRLLKGFLSFEDRKHLARGIVLSRIEYCLEATSSCPKTVLKLAGKILNKTVREVTGIWDYEQTEAAYRAVGWLNIEELAIWRTTKIDVCHKDEATKENV